MPKVVDVETEVVETGDVETEDVEQALQGVAEVVVPKVGVGPVQGPVELKTRHAKIVDVEKLSI